MDSSPHLPAPPRTLPARSPHLPAPPRTLPAAVSSKTRPCHEIVVIFTKSQEFRNFRGFEAKTHRFIGFAYIRCDIDENLHICCVCKLIWYYVSKSYGKVIIVAQTRRFQRNWHIYSQIEFKPCKINKNNAFQDNTLQKGSWD
jgi:hypothetical protein